jgi:hypothetical protein
MRVKGEAMNGIKKIKITYTGFSESLDQNIKSMFEKIGYEFICSGYATKKRKREITLEKMKQVIDLEPGYEKGRFYIRKEGWNSKDLFMREAIMSLEVPPVGKQPIVRLDNGARYWIESDAYCIPVQYDDPQEEVEKEQCELAN